MNKLNSYKNRRKSKSDGVALNSGVPYTLLDDLPPAGNLLFENFIEDCLLTTDELASRLNVSRHTIRKWRYRDEIPKNCIIKIGKRTIRYRWDKILMWLQT